MSDETRVYMGVFSTQKTPEEITATIGLNPDESFRLGDVISRTIVRRKYNGCMWNSGLPISDPLDIQVQTLLQRLEPWSPMFKRVSIEDTVQFTCVIYANHSPALGFDKQTVERIATFGASIDIDLYVFGDDDDDPDITQR